MSERTLFKVEAQLNELIKSVSDLRDEVKENANNKATVAQLGALEFQVRELRAEMRDSYVTKTEHGLVKGIVFGILSVVGLAIVSAIAQFIIGGGLIVP